MVYLIFGLLFLAGAIFNIFDRNYVELGGCIFFSLAVSSRFATPARPRLACGIP